jgi:antitoxin ParD1/3/4
LSNFAIAATLATMSTMNISLPEELKVFVDQQVSGGGYTSTSEYVRELLRRERDRAMLRGLLLEGMNSPLVGEADAAYFDGLRRGIRERAAAKAGSHPGKSQPEGTQGR